MDVLLLSAYLPPVQYYTKLLSAVGGTAYIEASDSYVKQTYRNRCMVVDANGPLALTIPTEKPSGEKCLMRDIRISDHGNWRHRHWNALESAYRHTPFFMYYEDDFRPFYERRVEFLYDFNMELTTMIVSLIGIDAMFSSTAHYEQAPEGVADFRQAINPKQPWQEDASFCPAPYYQVFKERHGFVPNVSIVDLLFNMGPESIVVLNESKI